MFKTYAIQAMHLEAMNELEEKVAAAGLRPPEALSWAEEDDYQRKPYQVVGGIALYSIQGTMLSSGNWFTRMLGIPTYDEIGNVLAQMAQDDMVEQVLVSMSTPGGHMRGLTDLSETWARLNKEKPVTVHTRGLIASAGLWLASNSSKVYASETAEVGSIGVMIQYMSREKMLKKEGIEVNVFKSAPLKAIGASGLDLTDQEKKLLQKGVEEAADFFKKQLRDTRPLLSSEAFTGEVFFAKTAQQYGLIDGVMTFQQAYEKLSASADSKQPSSYKETSMKRKVTQAMADAAIALGTDPDSLEVVSEEVYNALSEEEKAANAVAPAGDEGNQPEGEGSAPEGEAAAGDQAGAEGTPDTAEEVVALTSQVDELTTQLAEANAQLETMTSENAELKTKLEASAADPLRKIAEDRIGIMRVALGLSKLDMSEFPVASLLAEYNALDGQMKKAYVVGGRVKPKASEKPETVTVSSADKARFNATA